MTGRPPERSYRGERGGAALIALLLLLIVVVVFFAVGYLVTRAMI